MGPCLHAVALGGPLEVLELLTPIMAATVLLLSLACEHLFTVLPASPYFSSYSHTALSLAIVLVGATLAFLMVWTEFCVIKETSALTFMIAGTCKEVVTAAQPQRLTVN
ncbi:TPT domain-containing protein [Haematococcus lacustris]|uniref:TPT domain-containing protein n=1 Tax=Haematococcus lacustris TaxID=44745 RepID=A0A699ZKZ1_HAELA|nr:TPT domain-containing protein [Haematococcus lacustris]